VCLSFAVSVALAVSASMSMSGFCVFVCVCVCVCIYQPPKTDLLDATFDATDVILDAVLRTVAEEARW